MSRFKNTPVDLSQADKDRVLKQLNSLKNNNLDRIKSLEENVKKIEELIQKVSSKEYICISLTYEHDVLNLRYLEADKAEGEE